MKDRFTDLMKIKSGHTQLDEQEMIDRNAENGDDSGENNADMGDFFTEVGIVKNSMNKIRNNIDLIKDNYSKTLAGAASEQSKNANEDVSRWMEEIQDEQRKVRSILLKMADQNKNATPGATETRMRVNMHGTLTRKFMSLMQEYEELQTKYKNKIKDTVKRQLKIVNPEATEEQIDKVVEEKGSDPSHIFTEQMLDGARHQAAKDALMYVQNKHNDILRIEESILELHRLFQEMAILVETQSEIIDQIEYNVSIANDAIIKGHKEMVTANKYASRSRKKMCCIIIIVVVILGFLLWPIIQFSSGS